ncbi:unnamed protein product, partial [Toxocara canis]|uniref:DUF1758 domain-containing protein n=1 Tax=Toxocara canis TaxID=6265 RepID=A0A183U5D4_TOXCA
MKYDERIGMFATTTTSNIERGETRREDTKLTALFLRKEVLISSPRDPQTAAIVTAFFDSGCEGTFVTNELVKKQLHLESKSSQKLTMCGFESKNSTTYDSMQVALNIRLMSGSAKKVEAKFIERITQKIQTVDFGLEDLKNLDYEEVAKLKMPMKWKAPSG